MESPIPASVSIKYPQLTRSFPFPTYLNSLSGKTIMITGSSRGIGLAIAKKCALENAKIVILGK